MNRDRDDEIKIKIPNREIPILPVDVVGNVSSRYLIFPLIVLGDPFIFTTKYCIVFFLITIARNQSHLCTVDMARIKSVADVSRPRVSGKSEDYLLYFVL